MSAPPPQTNQIEAERLINDLWKTTSQQINSIVPSEYLLITVCSIFDACWLDVLILFLSAVNTSAT